MHTQSLFDFVNNLHSKQKGKNIKALTYISLFSSAGIGCYGFKQQGFKCIATNEYLEKRIKIQQYNNKCEFEVDIFMEICQQKKFKIKNL